MIREGTCARIARTFPGLNLYNNSLSKVVDTHDLISAWLSLRYFYLVVFFSLFLFVCTNYQALGHKGPLHT